MVRVAVWETENTGTVHLTLPEELGICSWAAVVRGDGKGDPALWVWIGVPEAGLDKP